MTNNETAGLQRPGIDRRTDSRVTATTHSDDHGHVETVYHVDGRAVVGAAAASEILRAA